MIDGMICRCCGFLFEISASGKQKNKNKNRLLTIASVALIIESVSTGRWMNWGVRF
jgi:hypothetical protein